MYTLQCSMCSMEHLISRANVCFCLCNVLPRYGSVVLAYVGVCMEAYVLSWICDNSTTYTLASVSWCLYSVSMPYWWRDMLMISRWPTGNVSVTLWSINWLIVQTIYQVKNPKYLLLTESHVWLCLIVYVLHLCYLFIYFLNFCAGWLSYGVSLLYILFVHYVHISAHFHRDYKYGPTNQHLSCGGQCSQKFSSDTTTIYVSSWSKVWNVSLSNLYITINKSRYFNAWMQYHH